MTVISVTMGSSDNTCKCNREGFMQFEGLYTWFKFLCTGCKRYILIMMMILKPSQSMQSTIITQRWLLWKAELGGRGLEEEYM